MNHSQIEFIGRIIEKFGPRRAGSDSENKAQNYLFEELNQFCDKCENQVFYSALTAKFQSLRLFCLVYLTSYALFFYYPIISFFLALLNSVCFFLHFNSYRHILDFLFPKIKSSNVSGYIDPSSNLKQTIIFAGHMDSTPEFIWWYWFKNWGARAMIYAGVSFVVFPVFILMSIYFPELHFKSIFQIILGLFGLAIPLSVVFYFIHGKLVVPGAQDNLSGISVAFHTIKNLAHKYPNGLKHTRIRMISFGSEETGLRGSNAYVKKNIEELIKENACLINLDGILDGNQIHIVKSEPMPWIQYDKHLIKSLSETFRNEKLSFKTGILPIGATDGASFARKKIPALTVIGLPLSGLHPTYHTRLDTIEWLNNDTLNKVTDVLVKFAENLDSSLSN